MSEDAAPENENLTPEKESPNRFPWAFLFCLGFAFFCGMYAYHALANVMLTEYASCENCMKRTITYFRHYVLMGLEPIQAAGLERTRFEHEVSRVSFAVMIAMMAFCAAYLVPGIKRARNFGIIISEPEMWPNNRYSERIWFWVFFWYGLIVGLVFIFSDIYGSFEIENARSGVQKIYNFDVNFAEVMAGNKGITFFDALPQMLVTLSWTFGYFLFLGLLLIGRKVTKKLGFWAWFSWLPWLGYSLTYTESYTADHNVLNPLFFGLMLLPWGFLILNHIFRKKPEPEPQKTKYDIMQEQAIAAHGNANFANWMDLHEAKMVGYSPIQGNFFLGTINAINPEGVEDTYQVFSASDDHMLTFAKARSGKGVGSIIPNLLYYPGSVITIDPKGENAAVTARVRRDYRGQSVFLLNPFGMHKEHFEQSGFTDITHGYNPLVEIHEGNPGFIAAAQKIALAIVPKNSHEKDPFWSNSARDMIYALILYVVFHRKAKDRHLGTVRKTLSLPLKQLREMFKEIGKDGHNEAVREAAARQAGDPDSSNDSFGGIVRTAMTMTDFLDMPEMQNVMTRHDFELRDLKTHKITVYLILPVEHLETCSSWLRIMVDRTLAAMSEEMTIPEKPVLFLLDEAARLGRIEKLASAPAALAGYGVRVWPIFQNMGQVEHLYQGAEWRDFVSNATIQLFGVNDTKTAEYFSKHMGTRGMVVETMSEGQGTSEGGSWSNPNSSHTQNTGTNLQILGRELMKPSEILQMDETQSLIIASGRKPALLQRAYYHEMDAFKEGKAPIYDENPYYRGEHK